jgi:glycosidase
VTESSWPDHAIWWQLHPVSFLGAPQTADSGAGQEDPAHRLGALEPWLDYLVTLGCNGLALGPVFAAESHGYDTVDHYRIDPRLGTDEDFGRLVAQCRERGVRLLLDGVFNHVGRGFAPFRDVLEHGSAARHASWFRLDFDAQGADGDGFGYADFEGHRHLVALDHDSPEVRDHVVGVMNHWLERGADGWRLDAAYAVPLDFWRHVTDRVRAAHPDAWFVGEYIHGDYAGAVREGGLDSITQYELWKAIWSSLNDGNFFELGWSLRRHDEYAARFRPLTFVGNHDVTRIASRLEDARHLEHALVLLFTLAGIPSIYAGDEQAFRGVKYDRADGDAEIRPAFPAGPGEFAPHGRPVFRLHQDLIGLRRRHPWLVRARTEVVHLASRTLGYRVSEPDGDGELTVLLNADERAFRFPLDTAAAKVLLAGAAGETGAAAGDAAGEAIPAHGWAILETGG